MTHTCEQWTCFLSPSLSCIPLYCSLHYLHLISSLPFYPLPSLLPWLWASLAFSLLSLPLITSLPLYPLPYLLFYLSFSLRISLSLYSLPVYHPFSSIEVNNHHISTTLHDVLNFLIWNNWLVHIDLLPTCFYHFWNRHNLTAMYWWSPVKFLPRHIRLRYFHFHGNLYWGLRLLSTFTSSEVTKMTLT